MREIVLDTETTGLDPLKGDRIVEIGCVELANHMPTGRTWHRHINPEREMSADAYAVHGLSTEFLKDKPVFAAVADEFLDFIGDAKLVIHNGAFDMGFLNAELRRCRRPPLATERLIDTLELARRRFPNAPNNLDALCRRFEIDTSARTKHGALIDCELLAAVYLELIGGRQPGFALLEQAAAAAAIMAPADRPMRPPRPHAPTAEELAAHAAFLDQIENPIWRQ